MHLALAVQTKAWGVAYATARCCILALPPALDRICWSPEAENMDMTFPPVGPVRKGRRAFQAGWLPKQESKG